MMKQTSNVVDIISVHFTVYLGNRHQHPLSLEIEHQGVAKKLHGP